MDRTDTERIDWLESQEGMALISDDCGHWVVCGDGMQNLPNNQRNNPQEIRTMFIIEGEKWKNSIREAIDAAIDEEEVEEVEV
jgi:hypothetical protein